MTFWKGFGKDSMWFLNSFSKKVVLFWSFFILVIIPFLYVRPMVAADEVEQSPKSPGQVTPNLTYRNKVTSLGGYSQLFSKAQSRRDRIKCGIAGRDH